MNRWKKVLGSGLGRVRGLIRDHETPAEHFDRMVASGRLRVGPHTYGHPEVVCYRGDEANASIGNYCSLAKDIRLVVGGNHRVDWVSTYPFRLMFDLPGALEDGHPATKGDIQIGHDVWIGAGATIMSGVTIGNGAVVAGCALVVKDVRAYSIVGGNPAKELKRRFSDAQIEGLERIAWWNWPQEKILAEVPGLCCDNIDAFIQKHEQSRA